jgi:hypothetical protein
MDTSKMIKAYCLKTKEKNVPMHDAVITKTARGGYMAGGNDGKGNKMALLHCKRHRGCWRLFTIFCHGYFLYA